MPGTTILVCMNDLERTDAMLSAMSVLAGQGDVHFVGCYVIPAVQVYGGTGLSAAQVFDGNRKHFQAEEQKTHDAFEAHAKAEGLSVEWRQVESQTTMLSDGVLPMAMICDMVLTSQSREDSFALIESEFVERLVMESGRPVLTIPVFGDFKTFGQSVLCAWNSTRESARAVFDALDVMKSAKRTEICWIDPAKGENGLDLPGAEIATVLARHGINTEVNAIATGGAKIGEALLSHAADTGADLIVMGAYGHSRMREFVFGGATQTMLEAMTVPVLMSH